jgi:hypothetical protein
MKNKVFILISILLATSISVINSSQANASDCSAENPCGTWAVVDNTGNVTNIIVCQPSVCGSGEFAGQKVVPQIAPNYKTHDTQGTGGWMTSGSTSVTEKNGTFTVSISEPSTTTTVEDNVQITTTVSQTANSFRYEDTYDYRNIISRPAEPSDNTSATVSVKENNNLIKEESKTFLNRKTTSEIETDFIVNDLKLLLSRIRAIILQLGLWVK